MTESKKVETWILVTRFVCGNEDRINVKKGFRLGDRGRETVRLSGVGLDEQGRVEGVSQGGGSTMWQNGSL